MKRVINFISVSNRKPISFWRTFSREAYIGRIILLALLFLIFMFNGLFAQATKENGNAKIMVVGRAYSDSIVLRYASTTPRSWEYMNKHGYVIERYTLVRAGAILRTPEKITINNVFKPLPLSEWDPLFKKGNKWAAIAAQALYGETFKLDNKSTNIFQIENKVKELESRFSFALFSADLSPAVAKASGLWFSDKSVKKGEKYLYRIYPFLQDTKLKIDTGFFYIGLDNQVELPIPVELSADFSDRSVLLKWNKEYFVGIFTAYYVERSDDGGRNFKQTTEDPLTQADPSPNKSQFMIYLDSLPENNKTYVYRIRGTTPFGEVSGPSETVSGKGTRTVTDFPKLATYNVMPNGNVLLQWSFPQNTNSELKGFVIERARSIQNGYKTLTKTPLHSTIRQFIDKHPDGTNYYKIKAMKMNGEMIESFPYLIQLRDSIPPDAPAHLEGKIDSSGVVILRWKANLESDLLGYRVFRANFSDDEYTQISVGAVTDSLYTDTISVNTLTKSIYYKIVAIDHHNNPSDFSKPLLLKRPDFIPPVSPVMTSIKTDNGNIVLEWNSSTSEDVSNYVLYRRCCNEKSWTAVTTLVSNPVGNKYVDQQVVASNIYEYTIIAIDESDLKSPLAHPVSIKAMVDPIQKPIQGISAEINRSKKFIRLTWGYADDKAEQFVIYRSTKGERLRLYKTVPTLTNEFVDNNLIVNTVYTYRVKALCKGGAQSPFSDEMIVNY